MATGYFETSKTDGGTITTTTTNGNSVEWSGYVDYIKMGDTVLFSRKLPLAAERIIFHNPATIVYWNDGTKTVVKCSGEEFDEEKGLTMAWMRKLYGSRMAFLRAIKNAERPFTNKKTTD